MIYCESPTLERWIAPPQEDLPRPTWTKLIAGGVLLSNSIEYANWVTNPVEPMVCEVCWNAGCVRSGLARVVNLADHILWLPPLPCEVDGYGLYDPKFIREAVLMPATTWERLRQVCPTLPSASAYARASRGDLAGLWMHEMPEELRAREPQQIENRLRTALASDPLELDPAREVVRSIVRWILEALEDAVEGTMVSSQTCDDAINTFYFDGYEWPSFVVGQEKGFVLGSQWVFIEGESA